MKNTKLIILLVLAALIALFFAFDLQQYLSLAELKARQADFNSYYQDNPLQTLGLFFGLYILVTALSLPGAAIMTLAAGALFGLATGLVLVSFASSIGATLAFLVSRYLFQDAVQSRFGNQLGAFNRGVERDGAFYLFTLRLVPLFPFFMINLLMGLTPIKARTFYWVSQVGMLAGTAVFVNAGTQLGQLESLSGILSPAILTSFVLLGIFPLLARKLIDIVKQRRALNHFEKPAQYDYNLVAIGAGAGGLVSTYIGAAVKARVALIEKHRMGGDCLNTGCVPSKALIRSAQRVHDMREAGEVGIEGVTPEVDFERVLESVQDIIRKVEPHDSVERYSGLGVECISGTARVISPYEVEVNGERLTTRNIVIATGARPLVPEVPGLEDIPYYTSDTIWELRSHPGRLLVLGGGPIGCELSQAFARLGADVTQVLRGERLMPREDTDAVAVVAQHFEKDGIQVLTGHDMRHFETSDGQHRLICDHRGEEVAIQFDTLLLALGRTPNARGLGLEEIGVQLDKRGALQVDEYLRSNIPNIYGVGDVTGGYQFTHTAAHQAWYAAVNALFGRFRSFRVDNRVIPWCTFTAPEVARVGLNEQEATAQQVPFEVTRFHMKELDRAITEREEAGFVKVLTVPGKDRILGVTIVGAHAGELIAEYVQAMKQGLGLNKILGTIHIYPTMSEANKYAAGEWKRAHSPQKLLQWVGRYHRWMRGNQTPAKSQPAPSEKPASR
ncbi:pyridine nucleotide-disulfide oxidoreductase [Marinobacterium aestuarii]|uniref:Pyridine nucleotide-disulfide oxidoreductase n=1 Tax=Marinobacterium aestuarii TaxID=1821621 RepID=A0A1A9F1C0_9GAMM|nr:FAD-dependent oxidoreductase [Marinobacterium aestuarii]ANG63957.1 pyridine nucleotide-disulfide oxidoreductase [Marinobacterium aestuarii]